MNFDMEMASKHSTDMKVPVRPAPAPPGHSLLQRIPSSPKPVSNLMDDWDLSFVDTVSKSGPVQSSQWQSNHNRKVPPPRPPPPKILMTSESKKNKQPSKTFKSNLKQPSSRPSELLTNLFSRRGQKVDVVGQTPSVGLPSRGAASNIPPSPAVVTASLIDLSSPPSSPTPTTRSSSDGLSVDSFGSDGTTSHSHHHSQVESGFEDDSDLFGGFTATPSPIHRDPWTSTSSTPSEVFSPVNPVAPASVKNPWHTTPQDPFSPPRRSACTPSPTPAVPHVAPTPGVPAFKPTIIRPKVKPNVSPSFSRAKAVHPTLLVEDNEGEDRSDSPPMPSIPPPAPPPELLTEIADRKLSLHGPTCQEPHCIALFNFEASQPDDLSFKEGDTIKLLRQVNEDWLYGCHNGKEGMFPANFVRIVIPLNDTGGITATAIYSFTPETWEDLDLQEGCKVRLLGRINDDWLYGEYDGKQGQFPVTFVDHVPPNLPMHSS